MLLHESWCNDVPHYSTKAFSVPFCKLNYLACSTHAYLDVPCEISANMIKGFFRRTCHETRIALLFTWTTSEFKLRRYERNETQTRNFSRDFFAFSYQLSYLRQERIKNIFTTNQFCCANLEFNFSWQTLSLASAVQSSWELSRFIIPHATLSYGYEKLKCKLLERPEGIFVLPHVDFVPHGWWMLFNLQKCHTSSQHFWIQHSSGGCPAVETCFKEIPF